MITQSVRPTQAVEDYIKAIHALQELGRPVTTTGLAKRLEVTPSSASAMLTRLREMGLISHRPFAEATLTADGLQVALRVARRRRLIELFLIETLDYGWDEVEHEAEILGRAATDEFVERIAAKLNHPVVDPHGDPIPSPSGEVLVAPSHRLSTLQPGASGRLVRIWNGHPEILRYLDQRGIAIGEHIVVLDRQPFGGSIIVQVGNPDEPRVHGFGYELAELLSIELDASR